MTQRPPTLWLLAYRLLGVRLPYQYRPWVAEDVTSRWFVTFRALRTFLWGLAAIGLFYLGQTLTFQPPGRATLVRFGLVALAVSLLGSGKTLVRRTLRWQRVDKQGNPVRPRRLAVLGNAEATVLGVSLAVVLTGGSAVWADLVVRNDDLSNAPCHKVSSSATDHLKSSFKDADVHLNSLRSVSFGDGRKVIAGWWTSAVHKQTQFVAFVQTKDGFYEWRAAQGGVPSVTNLPSTPSPDFVSPEALRRVLGCIALSGPR